MTESRWNRKGLRASGEIAAAVIVCALAMGAPAQQLPVSRPTVPGSGEPASGLSDATASSPPGQQAWGTIHGLIRSAEGDAYEGALVELKPSGATLSRVQEAVSGSAGDFLFADVPPGPFTLTVSSPGFDTQTVSGTAAAGASFEAAPVVLAMTRARADVVVSATRFEIAQEQLHEEEQQRVLGILPNFYVAYDPHAAPLTPAQKFHLSLVSLIDPTTFLGSVASAGLKQADRDPKGIGQGAGGFAQRFALDYGDNAIGTMIGSALLPSLLRQDPRYFYKGKGSILSRLSYAVAATVICRGDNGRWQPDYSRIIGDFAGAGIAQLYHPAADRQGGVEIVENFGIARASGAIENVLQEFVVRRFTHHMPLLGDAKAVKQ